MRVYLDTNVQISAFATRGLCADILHIVVAEHQLVAGDAVLEEVRRVLRLKIGLPVAAVTEVEALLRQQAAMVTDVPRLKLRIRDPDDLAILSEAVAGSSDVLVTGDRHLIDIASKAPIRIVSPRGFWELLRARPTPE